MKSVGQQLVPVPPVAPVMFLSAVLMPHVMMPLFIFEPRYRAMLQHCLEHDRMFCIALLRPGVQEVSGPEDYFPTAGLGLLRACVGHPDGTSHLVLQGLARVELQGWEQERPFRLGRMEELFSSAEEGPEAGELCARIREQCAAMLPSGPTDRATLQEQIAHLTDAGTLCDVAAHTFLHSPYRQQEVLEELRVEERLPLTLRHLQEEHAGK